MRSTLASVAVALAIITTPPKAHAQFECPDPLTSLYDTGALTSAHVGDVSEITSETEVSPFVRACQEPNALKDRPTAKWFHRRVPLQDKTGRPTRDFLKKLGERAMKDVEDNLSATKKILDCASAKGEDRQKGKCPQLVQFVEKNIPNEVAEARLQLALAQTDSSVSHFIETKASADDLGARARFSINKELNTLGTFKETKWEPLTATEIAQAKKRFDEEFSEISRDTEALVAQGELPGPVAGKVRGIKAKVDHPKTKAFRNTSLLLSQINHGSAYKGLLNSFPVLQFIGKAKPNSDEVIKAFEKLYENQVEEKAFLEDMQKRLSVHKEPPPYFTLPDDPNAEWVDPKTLSLLEYSGHLESMLEDSPQECGLASALVYTKESRDDQIRKAGFAVMAASFVFPAALVIPLAATQGYLAIEIDQSKLNRSKQRYLSKVIRPEDDTARAEVEKSLKERNLSVGLAAGTLVLPIAAQGTKQAIGLIGKRKAASEIWSQLKLSNSVSPEP